MADNSLEKLSDRFPEEILKKKKRGNKELLYAPWAYYAEKLNEVFGAGWSFTIVKHDFLTLPNGKYQAFVLVELRIGDTVRMAFGGSEPRSKEHLHEITDEYKSAQSDALKKAASLFGLGLYLSKKEEDVNHGAESRSQGRSQSQRTQRPSKSESSERRSGGSSGGTLTGRQLNAVNAIGRALGWTSEDLVEHCIESYGVGPAELCKSDASDFIHELQRMTKSGGEPKKSSRKTNGKPATDRQQKAILAIGADLGLSAHETLIRVRGYLEIPPERLQSLSELSSVDASSVIDKMKEGLESGS